MIFFSKEIDEEKITAFVEGKVPSCTWNTNRLQLDCIKIHAFLVICILISISSYIAKKKITIGL